MYKVLLVDDEALIREAISENIPWEEMGFELIASCENGREAMERMADRFLERLQAATGTRFQELGEALKNASYVQAASVKNEKSVMDAAAALTESSRHLQETMDRMMRRQEELTGEISEQGKLLAQACEEISSEVSSQLYTFEQMRTTYED